MEIILIILWFLSGFILFLCCCWWFKDEITIRYILAGILLSFVGLLMLIPPLWIWGEENIGSLNDILDKVIIKKRG